MASSRADSCAKLTYPPREIFTLLGRPCDWVSQPLSQRKLDQIDTDIVSDMIKGMVFGRQLETCLSFCQSHVSNFQVLRQEAVSMLYKHCCIDPPIPKPMWKQVPHHGVRLAQCLVDGGNIIRWLLGQQLLVPFLEKLVDNRCILSLEPCPGEQELESLYTTYIGSFSHI